MNIFEALSYGKGRINEENTSSFLAYLLNPNETHGLKDIFLKRFLTLIDNNLATDDTLQLNDILLEERFYNKEKNWCSLDITLRLNNLSNGDIFIAIENKINKQAFKQNQLQNEINYMCVSEEIKEYKKKKIILILPYEYDDDKISDKIKVDFTKHQPEWECKIITWNDILKILKNILSQENSCEIPPLYDYVKQTIKAFIIYMEIKPIEKTFDMYLDNFESIKKLKLQQFPSKMAKLFIVDKNKEDKNISVYKPLYNFLKECKECEVSKSMNTRQIAQLFINIISSNQGILDNYNNMKENKTPQK